MLFMITCGFRQQFGKIVASEQHSVNGKTEVVMNHLMPFPISLDMWQKQEPIVFLALVDGDIRGVSLSEMPLERRVIVRFWIPLRGTVGTVPAREGSRKPGRWWVEHLY